LNHTRYLEVPPPVTVEAQVWPGAPSVTIAIVPIGPVGGRAATVELVMAPPPLGFIITLIHLILGAPAYQIVPPRVTSAEELITKGSPSLHSKWRLM
jgi:hypothetical protein